MGVLASPNDFPLPPNLPVPEDDGAARHLLGIALPAVALESTAGRMVDVSHLIAARTVIYCYPMTGVPGQPLPAGWDNVPGARGCTPQSCGFRDHYLALLDLQVQVFGLSTQSTAYQREMATRLQLPFEVLSDADFRLSNSLRFPMFEVEGMGVLKRLTLIVRGGLIEHFFYPVFPPNESAAEVVGWLKRNPLS